MVVGSIAAAVLAVGVLVVTQGDDGPGRITSGSTPDSTTPTDVTTTTVTTTTEPPTTTAPSPTVAVGEDRLSTESRLGYEGLGPIKLGMSFDDAVAAAHVTVQPDPTCGITLYGEPGSGVESIEVWNFGSIGTITVSRPGINTISGVGVGSTRAEVLATYPSASDDLGGSGLVITNPEGHAIVFTFDGGDSVTSMALFADLQAREIQARC